MYCTVVFSSCLKKTNEKTKKNIQADPWLMNVWHVAACKVSQQYQLFLLFFWFILFCPLSFTVVAPTTKKTTPPATTTLCHRDYDTVLCFFFSSFFRERRLPSVGLSEQKRFTGRGSWLACFSSKKKIAVEKTACFFFTVVAFVTRYSLLVTRYHTFCFCFFFVVVTQFFESRCRGAQAWSGFGPWGLEEREGAGFFKV